MYIHQIKYTINLELKIFINNSNIMTLIVKIISL